MLRFTLAVIAVVIGLASATNCNCDALMRAEDVPSRLTPMDTPNPAFGQCASSPPSFAATARMCNEPIPANQDLRGVYGIPQGFPLQTPIGPIPAPQDIPLIIVDQCGDWNKAATVQLLLLRGGAPTSGQTPIARDFRIRPSGPFGQVSAKGDNVFVDLLNLGSELLQPPQCRPTTLIATNLTDDDVVLLQSDSFFRVTRFSFIGTPASRETFGLRQIPSPFGGLIDAFTITQLFPPSPPVNIALLRISGPPASQTFQPAECFEECKTTEEICFETADDDDDAPGFCKDIRDAARAREADRIYTPCGPAQQTGGSPDDLSVDCGYDAVGQSMPLGSLDFCTLSRDKDIAAIDEDWSLSNGQTLKIRSCGDRLQLFFVDDSHVFDFRTTGSRVDGAWGLEPPTFNGGVEGRLAGYIATADDGVVTLTNAADPAQQIVIGLNPNKPPNGNNRELQFSYYDYSTDSVVSLTGDLM